MHGVAAGVRRDHLDAQRVVGLGVAAGGERDGDDDGVGQQGGGGEGGADQGDRGELRGAGADQGQQDQRAEAAQLVELGGGEGVGDRDDRAAGVPLAGLRRGEPQAAERAELGVGERLDVAARPGDPGQRQPLGVDQLDRAGRRACGGDRSRAAAG